MKNYKSMLIQCKKCESHLVINPKDWYMLGDLDCISCGEESELNWMIIGGTDRVDVRTDIKEEIKIQKYCRENGIDREDYLENNK